MTSVLFINSGVLGLSNFAEFVRRQFAVRREGLRVRQTVLSDGLTLYDRVARRALCTRLWPDGLAGMRNLDLFRFRAELNSGLQARRRIRALEARGEHFDVLHFHRQAAAYGNVARMRRTPSIVSIDVAQGYLIERAHNRAEASSYLPSVWEEQRIFDAARLIVSTSVWAAEGLRARYPDCGTEVVVMPNPVLLEYFPADWAEARLSRGLAGHRPRVLFVGGDFVRKGGPQLLEAWERGGFAARAHLDLVTSDEHAASLPAGVTLHRAVHSYSPAWQARWRAADLFAMPTRDEAFGLVYQEAAAAGIPAIGPRMNAIPEIIRDGETGVLVPPGDIDALGHALERLLDSPRLRHQMGVRARAQVAESASGDRYRERLIAAIHRLAGEGS